MSMLRACSRTGQVSLEIPTARVFLPLLEPRRYKGARGGRGSGKSRFYGGRLIEECLYTHIRAVCAREIQLSIKDSVKQLLEDEIRRYGVGGYFDITEREIRGPNESLFVFKGLQNHTAQSIKSLEGFNRLVLEEAQTMSQRSIDLAFPTIRAPGAEIWAGWNPDKPTDPIDKFFRENADDDDVVCVEANYRDNPWFPDDLRADMERDKRRDPDKYSHVWLGQYRKLSEARVFRNWRIGDPKEFNPRPDRYYFGGDFGFSVDPTVLIRCYIEGRTLYIDREVYMVGCEIDHTPFLWGGCQDEALKKLNEAAWNSIKGTAKEKWTGIPGARKWPIIADSARPETISYLRRHGFSRVRGAKKGAGSVEEGVEFLKSFDIVVHPNCIQTIDEFSNYSWKMDPKTGEVLPVLEDKKNHVIDANRYAVEPLRRGRAGLF